MVDTHVFNILVSDLLQAVGAGPLPEPSKRLIAAIESGEIPDPSVTPAVSQSHLWLVAHLYVRAGRQLLLLQEIQRHLIDALQLVLTTTGNRSFEVAGVLDGHLDERGELVVHQVQN